MSQDLAATIDRQDLVWDTPPTRWHEAPFVGSGRVGCYLTVADNKELLIHLGHGAAQNHRPRSDGDLLFDHARLPVGRVSLALGDISACALRLDLHRAVISGSLTANGQDIEIEAFAPAGQNIVIIRLRGCQASLRWLPGQAISSRYLVRNMAVPRDHIPEPPCISRDAHTLTAEQELGQGWFLRSTISDCPDADGWRCLFCRIDHEQGEQAAVPTDVGTIAGQVSCLRREHEALWAERWQRSAIRIPDPALEQLWYLQIYKLASASWPGSEPCDLQGPWFHPSPWVATWWNLNMQLTYGGAALCGHGDLLEPVDRWFTRNAAGIAARTPQGPYPAAAIGRVSMGDAISPPNDEYCNLIWALQVWDDGLQRLDDQEGIRLRLRPLLIKAVGHACNLLEEGDDDRLHMPLGCSPEYRHRARDCNYHLALIRWGCQRLLELQAQFGAANEAGPDYATVLARLAPYPVNEHGLMIGAEVGLDESHRHYSHLLMYHPLHLESWDDPAARRLIEESLERWHSFPQALLGYSFTGAAAMRAHLGQGAAAVELLTTFTRRFLHPNSFYTEFSDSPVIETPLHAAWSLSELLLQEHEGVIRCFHGLPDQWQEASFHHLVTRQAVKVSAWRCRGTTVGIRLESARPQTIRCLWQGEVRCLELAAGQALCLGDCNEGPDRRPPNRHFGLARTAGAV